MEHTQAVCRHGALAVLEASGYQDLAAKNKQRVVRDRIAMCYEWKDGKLALMGPDTLGGGDWRLRKGASNPLPEDGIYSTAADLAQFYQMLLNGGALGSLTLPLESLGSYSHGGACGTSGWVDPRHDLVGVFLVQRPSANDERNAFMAIAGSAIVD